MLRFRWRVHVASSLRRRSMHHVENIPCGRFTITSPLLDRSASVLTMAEQLVTPLLLPHSSGSNASASEEAIGVARARWWVLLQYSLLTFNQVLMLPPPLPPLPPPLLSLILTKGWYWDIPGPIFQNYISVYNLSQDTLQVTRPSSTS